MLKDKKGYSTALLTLLLPVIICVLGFAIDGGLAIYRANELSSAVKIAAISTTSIYEVDDSGGYILTADFDEVQDILEMNMEGAVLMSLSVDENTSGKCTVEGCYYVDFVFMKMFGIKGKTVTSSFTARRGSSELWT